MTTRTFVLGTRGSRLALAQSTTVARAIEEAGARLGEDAVSYTHLTLPTICSV